MHKSRFTTSVQSILFFSFILMVIVVLGTSFWVTAGMISDYLTQAEKERVRSELRLAHIIFNDELSRVREEAQRLSSELKKEKQVMAAFQGDLEASAYLGNLVTRQLLWNNFFDRTLFVVMLDKEGQPLFLEKGRRLILGFALSPDGTISSLPRGAKEINELVGTPNIVEGTLKANCLLASVEILPVEFLASLGLAEEAQFELLDAPQAEEAPFDPREGTAALALVGAAPVSYGAKTLGVVLVASLLNNDVSLVDHIRDMAQTDTATIFMGDLRVSTNMLTPEGKRAVGTRVSGMISQAVLSQGATFIGPAFVVNERFITGYEPLRDHTDQVIGMLYVGVREARFLALLYSFYQRIELIVLGAVVLTLVLAVPLSRYLAGPINALVRASQQIIQGDLSVHVPERGSQELVLLARSFNEMAESLSQAREAEQRRMEEILTVHEAQARLLETVHALSSPVIPLYEGIVILPLVGHIDTARSQQIMEELLQGVGRHQAQVVILDITGVAVVDTKVAQHLVQTAKATRLLGCQVVLVGIRPEVAQTLVELGVDLVGIITYQNLQAGLEYALTRIKRRIASAR